MVSQPICLGCLVVGSGSIDLLLVETLIEFRVGGLGSIIESLPKEAELGCDNVLWYKSKLKQFIK